MIAKEFVNRLWLADCRTEWHTTSRCIGEGDIKLSKLFLANVALANTELYEVVCAAAFSRDRVRKNHFANIGIGEVILSDQQRHNVFTLSRPCIGDTGINVPFFLISISSHPCINGILFRTFVSCVTRTIKLIWRSPSAAHVISFLTHENFYW